MAPWLRPVRGRVAVELDAGHSVAPQTSRPRASSTRPQHPWPAAGDTPMPLPTPAARRILLLAIGIGVLVDVVVARNAFGVNAALVDGRPPRGSRGRRRARGPPADGSGRHLDARGRDRLRRDARDPHGRLARRGGSRSRRRRSAPGPSRVSPGRGSRAASSPRSSTTIVALVAGAVTGAAAVLRALRPTRSDPGATDGADAAGGSGAARRLPDRRRALRPRPARAAHRGPGRRAVRAPVRLGGRGVRRARPDGAHLAPGPRPLEPRWSGRYGSRVVAWGVGRAARACGGAAPGRSSPVVRPERPVGPRPRCAGTSRTRGDAAGPPPPPWWTNRSLGAASVTELAPAAAARERRGGHGAHPRRGAVRRVRRPPARLPVRRPRHA